MRFCRLTIGSCGVWSGLFLVAPQQANAQWFSCLLNVGKLLDSDALRRLSLAKIDRFLKPIKYYETRVAVSAADAKILTDAARHLANTKEVAWRGEFFEEKLFFARFKKGALIHNSDVTVASLSSVAAGMPTTVPVERYNGQLHVVLDQV